MVDTLSPDLQASIEPSWQALSALPPEQAARARRALGLWCVAQEPLPLAMVARLVDCPAGGEEALQEATRPFLSTTPGTPPDGEALHGPSSDETRAFVLARLAADEIVAQHRTLGTWPLRRRSHRRYVLKHGIHHRIEVGAWQEVERLGFDPGYLIAQCRELDLGAAQAGVALARDRLGTKAAIKLAADLNATSDPEKQAQLLKDFTQGKGDKENARWNALSTAMLLGEPQLLKSPSALLSLLYNQMRGAGLESRDIIRLMGLPKGRPRLRLEHPLQMVQQARDLREAAPPGHAEAVNACAMTADGERAVSASVDATLKVWDLKTATLLFTLQGHTGPVTSAAITPDGRTVISGSTDGTVLLWELPEAPSAQPVVPRVVPVNESDPALFGVQLTPDGKSILFGARLANSSFGSILRQSLSATPGTIAEYVWQPGSRMTAAESARQIAELAKLAAMDSSSTASSDEMLAALDAYQNSEKDVSARFGEVGPSAFTTTPDGQRLIVGLDDGSLFMKDISDLFNDTLVSIGVQSAAVTAVVVTRDGRRVITGSRDSSLKIWDLVSHECLATLEGHTSAVTACAVTPDGRRLISLSDEALRVWDLQTYSCLESCPGSFSFQGLAAGQGRVCAGDGLGNVAMFELSEPAASGSGTVRATGPIERCCAVLVGSSEYSGSGLGNLPYGINDVQELGSVLEERGYDVLSLHDAQEQSFLCPTREHIVTELSLLHLNPNDMLLVYFSCHGVQVNGKTYLLTRECDAQRLVETGLPLAEVIERMAATGARRQVLLLDACYAGVGLFGRQGGGPKVNLNDLDPAPVEPPAAPEEALAPRAPAATRVDPGYLRDTFELAEGFALLAASTAAEKSHDRTTQSHALFTSLVIEGIAGAADRDSKGFVTVDDLKKHVLAGVTALVRSETGLPQSPTARIEGKGDMVLARVLPGQGPRTS